MKFSSLWNSSQLSFSSSSSSPSTAGSLVYKPVESARAIRLANILPSRAPSRPVVCELQEVQLDHGLQSYKALSYCWGQSSRKTSITCNGQRLEITEDLLGALRHLRSRDEVVTIWVDQICINQKNVGERGKQVQLMRDIYRCAEKVVVWLGEEADDSKLAYEFLHRVVKVLESCQKQLSESQLQDKSLPPFHAREWRALSALLSRPWFGRMWVLQELAVSSSATILCGKQQVSWNVLRDLILRMSTAGTWDNLFKVHRPQGTSADFLRSRLRHITEFKLNYEGNHSMSMKRLLLGSRWFEASDPRDKVFALLGLTPANHGIFPDYTKNVDEIYRKVAANVLFMHSDKCPVAGRGHEAMSLLAEVDRSEWKLDLPSWVPDWTANSRDSFWCRHGSLGYKAAGDSAIRLSWCKDPNHICIAGKIVDAVQLASNIAPPEVDSLDPRFVKKGMRTKQAEEILAFSRLPLSYWIYETSFIAAQCGQYNTLDFEAREKTYWRTLLANGSAKHCNEHFNHYKEIPISEYSKHYWHFRQYLAIICPNRVPNGADFANFSIALQPHIEGFTKFAESLALTSLDRRFFATLGGYMGIGSSRMQPGDLICVFLGGCVPWVIRKEGKEYALIGECYVDGFMDGEAMESEYLTVEDIILK
ncbi:MAG: hypothetical protein M1834_005576 [Cirrosporium novae-zelandiae]|nr:MAG: hypothetical protein M1834_005576 [Cirrosporium novae-zelandiae]